MIFPEEFLMTVSVFGKYELPKFITGKTLSLKGILICQKSSHLLRGSSTIAIFSLQKG